MSIFDGVVPLLPTNKYCPYKQGIQPTGFMPDMYKSSHALTYVLKDNYMPASM